MDGKIRKSISHSPNLSRPSIRCRLPTAKQGNFSTPLTLVFWFAGLVCRSAGGWSIEALEGSLRRLQVTEKWDGSPEGYILVRLEKFTTLYELRVGKLLSLIGVIDLFPSSGKRLEISRLQDAFCNFHPNDIHSYNWLFKMVIPWFSRTAPRISERAGWCMSQRWFCVNHQPWCLTRIARRSIWNVQKTLWAWDQGENACTPSRWSYSTSRLLLARVGKSLTGD